jgi:hypothetical protein
MFIESLRQTNLLKSKNKENNKVQEKIKTQEKKLYNKKNE